VVVDHGLQSGSADVAARVADGLRGRALSPVEVVRAAVRNSGQGVEAAARAARYAALDDAAVRLGAAAVLLGHTLDDQAETVLLGLARGSGARSLAGMRPASGRWLRPMLSVPRDATVAACAAEGFRCGTTRTTATRGSPAPGCGHTVLPMLERELGPGVSAALARTAEQLARDADALDAWAYAASARCQGEHGLLTVRWSGCPVPCVPGCCAKRLSMPAARRPTWQPSTSMRWTLW
jgi:tRNA(Ile)-lysidine synthase